MDGRIAMLLRTVLLAAAFTAAATAAAPQVIVISYYSRESEPNDTTQTAGLLLSGGAYAPSYSPATDVDYYRLDVASTPSTLTVHVQGVSSVVISGDPELWLEDTSGTVLAYHDDIAPIYNLDCFLRYVFTSPGDYYVRVEHSSKSEWFWNYSNYYLWGDYQFEAQLAAVRPSRWMLYH